MDEPASHKKQIILLKLTGEVLQKNMHHGYDNTLIVSLAKQIQELAALYYFGIVIGGGNFFRGSVQGKQLQLSASVGHHIGMLATIMNGLIIQDIFQQHGIPTALLSAHAHTGIGMTISPNTITHGIQNNGCIIFVGGTGIPFFTTDTTAIIRALQMQATIVWKATNVDGIFQSDPKKNPQAAYIPTISCNDAIQHRLGIMDQTALVLAHEHHIPIRVFNIFQPDALIRAAYDTSFGSFITP